MGYLASSSINVFPAVKRSSDYQAKARLMTEENMTRPYKVVWGDSYVLSKKNDNFLEFILDGYYIKVNTLDSIISSIGSYSQNVEYDLYAEAQIIQTTGTGYIELQGQDSGSNYTGINFAKVNKDATFTPSSGMTNYMKVCSFHISSNHFVINEINDERDIDLSIKGDFVAKDISAEDINAETATISTSLSSPTITSTNITNSNKIASPTVECQDANGTTTIDGWGIRTTSSTGVNLIAGKLYVGTSGSQVVADSGNIAIDGNETIGGNETINGNATISGTTSLGNTLTISTGGANIIGNTSVNGSLTSSNALTVGSNGADITGDSIVKGDLTVREQLSVAGGFTFGNSGGTIDGKATINGGVEAKDNVTITNSNSTNRNNVVIKNSSNTNVLTIDNSGKVSANGGFFSNGLIAPLFSTTLPSDFNAQSVLENTRTYCEYKDSRPTNAPSTSPTAPRVATLEVFHTGSSNTDQYALQRYTNVGPGIGTLVYYRVMKKASGSSSWTVYENWD